MIPHLDHLTVMAVQARNDALASANQLERAGIGKGFTLQRTAEQIMRMRDVLDAQTMTADFLEALVAHPVEAHAALLSIGKGRAA